MSLIARKSIKEHEPAIAEAKKGFQDAIGSYIEIAPEFDRFLQCKEIPADDIKHIGEYVKRFVTTIKDETVSYFGNAVAKKLFADNVKMIILTPGTKGQGDKNIWTYEAQNQSLVMKVDPEMLAYSLNYYSPVTKVLEAFKYSFLVNLEEEQAAFGEKLEKIKATLGSDWSLNHCIEHFYDLVEADDRKHLPEYILRRHMSQVVSDMEAIGADEMAKEAFLDKVTSKTIQFIPDATIGCSTKAKFESGQYVVLINPTMISYSPSSQLNWIMENL